LSRTRDYSRLHDALKDLDAWWHYLESTWLVVSDKTADDLWSLIQSQIGPKDRILIVRLTNDYSGFLPDEAWDWIREHLAAAPGINPAATAPARNQPVVSPALTR
jgi:hypothetical protein